MQLQRPGDWGMTGWTGGCAVGRQWFSWSLLSAALGACRQPMFVQSPRLEMPLEGFSANRSCPVAYLEMRQ